MKKFVLFTLLLFNCLPVCTFSQGARMLPEITPEGKGKVNTRIDNIGYWSRMAELGYVRVNPGTAVPKSSFTGTGIRFYEPSPVTRHASRSISSPDIPVTSETNVTQSENSVFIDPADENVLLNSNNSSGWTSGHAINPNGADALYSLDNGQDWGGSSLGVNGKNSGDPSTAIGLNGWWYVGRITNDWGQAVSYSKDQGNTWTYVKVGEGPAGGYGLLDKNHLCIDNSLTSPFKGYLYAAWTNFNQGNADTNQVEIVRSTDHGITWSSPYNISSAAAALKINHGVNLQAGPNGEVYAAWSIYDGWPADENAIGFAKSVDGGGIFMPATRIISNIKGIRASMTGKNMRVNSFPSMTVDNSMSPNRGTIYLVWANVGYPGVNTGTNIDVYMIRSADAGSSWTAPIRVNQDPAGLGKQHFFPWITCDQVTGGLCVIYYDDRNVDSTMVAVFVSSSYDGGNTWTDMQVSDFTFTPQPIPGLTFSYFGDYIGIQSNNMKVYPVWTDNHDGGRAMTYTSPFDLGPNPNQPWVTWYSDSLATVFGHGSADLNYGDSLYLSLGLKNIGDQQAAGVNAVVTSTSPYIMFTDSTAEYDTMAPGQVKTLQDGYTFKVSDTIPDNQMVRFNVRAANADSAWYSHFAVQSHAPALRINGITIIDTLEGNHNGRFDAGETAEVEISTANTGDFKCSGSYGQLSTTSPYLSFLQDSVSLGDIEPGAVKKAIFTAVVDSETPAGSGIDLVYTANSGLYKTHKLFREMVGTVIEDWETNTFTKFQWQQGGSKPWIITNNNPWEGNYCARSGTITDYQTSQLFITYTSVTDDSISFYLSTSSEQDYDFLIFYIDGVLQGQWSGETSWMRAAFPVSAGQHSYKWKYLKDLAYSSGQDCAWVDFISMPPQILPVVDPGPADTICTGMDVMLQATALLSDSIKWTSDGDGIFGNDTLLITTYRPGMSDLDSGGVTLRLTGYGPFGNTGKNKPILIHPVPVVSISVFPNDTVCTGQEIILHADTSGINSWNWTPGNFTTYVATYDTSNAGGMGVHLVRLLVKNEFGCQQRDSVFVAFKNCTGIPENMSEAVSIYPNPNNGNFLLEMTAAQASPLRLSISNALSVIVFREDNPAFASNRVKNMNLAFLPDGVYLLSVTTSHGTTAHKLIIRK